MNETQDEFAERIASRVGTAFVVLLGALFAYGYLAPLL